MAIIQAFISIDNLYHKVNRKVILNDVKLTDDRLKDLIYTTAGEKISLIPQCECGNLHNGFRLGKMCSLCNTDVVKPFDNIDPLLWTRTFRDDLKWLNPHFWVMLSNIISTKVDGLRWLADTSYNPPKPPEVLPMIAEVIGGRSYLNVINNIEKIIMFLRHNSKFKTMVKTIKLNILLRKFRKNKDILFSTHLPMINKRLFISETSKDGRYDTMLLADVVDNAVMAVVTANDVDTSDKRLQNATAKLISSSGNLFINYIRDMVGKKQGLLRKNVYGTRVHFSFRAVITSLSTIYDYDEIHVPWVVGVSAFRPHLLNKLMGMDYTLDEASELLFTTAFKHNDLIDTLLKELIAESDYKGLPVLFNRNPSLGLPSLALVYIAKFKTDITDNSISHHLMLCSMFNSDFDGDEMNAAILLDNHLVKLANGFSPHFNGVALTNYQVSGNLHMPKTHSFLLSKYLSTVEPEAEVCEVFNELLALDKIELDLTKPN